MLTPKGYLAQQYALTYSEKLSHLILRGTAPSYHRMFEVAVLQTLALMALQTKWRL
jgi:pimeloyl-ACP methyl ester carboxylesterase